jgi:hypothetical protein
MSKYSEQRVDSEIRQVLTEGCKLTVSVRNRMVTSFAVGVQFHIYRTAQSVCAEGNAVCKTNIKQRTEEIESH